MKSEYFKALLTFLHSSDESLCITFIFILLIAKKIKKNSPIFLSFYELLFLFHIFLFRYKIAIKC